jgi:hypothetical protein
MVDTEFDYLGAAFAVSFVWVIPDRIRVMLNLLFRRALQLPVKAYPACKPPGGLSCPLGGLDFLLVVRHPFSILLNIVNIVLFTRMNRTSSVHRGEQNEQRSPG